MLLAKGEGFLAAFLPWPLVVCFSRSESERTPLRRFFRWNDLS